MTEQIEQKAIEEMSRVITCVDIETEPEGTCCRMNFDQSDTMACALYNAGYRYLFDLTPCDVCLFNPPSSRDGKPCPVCPAQAKGGTE